MRKRLFAEYMNRLLLVVDPQLDFISGTLPVPGATEAMNQLAEFTQNQNGAYVCKVVTTDWHPASHCSFVSNGGQWTAHCVQNSVGASLYPAVEKALLATSGHTTILRKGTDENQESYSIFRQAEPTQQFDEIMKRYQIDQIDVCGIAGDICVLNTLKDGIERYGNALFQVLTPFSPSLDGGTALTHFINDSLR